MNTQEPLITIICVFRNKKDWIEPTLKALYSIQDLSCEYIFIDDGSTDGSSEVIQSLVEHYQHPQTYFFEQEAGRGRGNSINSALEHARGRIVWIPESVQQVDRYKLAEAVETLLQSDARVAIASEEPLPENAMDWLHLLQNNRLPFDRHYLFDLEKIRPYRTFTDPHWTTRHASEWAIRLQSDSGPIHVTPFADGNNEYLEMDGRTKKECVFSLLRVPELSLSGQEKAFRLLRTIGYTDLEEEAGSMEPLYQEAQALYKGGNSVAALQLLNRILAADPGHHKSRHFKVEILERLRRYVEAAEVKHGYSPARDSDTPAEEAELLNTDIPDSDTGQDADSISNEDSTADENASADTSQGDPDHSTESPAVPSDDADETPSTEPIDTEANTGGDPDDRQEEIDREADPDGAFESKTTTSPGSGQLKAELRDQLPLTVIIPTATHRRPVLEACLNSVLRFTAKEKTRIIVIDNGSVDDTSEYLNSLLRDSVPLTVLTNDQNLGFAAAVNQALAKAGDGFMVVMHNDVTLKSPVPARLTHLLEKNPDIGLVTPRTDHTWNPDQSTDEKSDVSGLPELSDVDMVDGYCMAFRNEPGLVLSKQYGLAYFEDTDFCYRIQKKGYRIAVANREAVTHRFGTTTSDLGLSMHGKKYWENASRFQSEWDIEPRFPANRTGEDALRQFVVLGELINPFFPEKHLLALFDELFTSEQRTRVFHAEFPPDALKSMIRLMMATNQREVLRRLELQLEKLPPDIALYHDLITFYYDRTIYSRCKKYLDRLNDQDLPADLSIYHLKIAIGEKDYQRAAELLNTMMDHIPTHPEVLMAAADIHRRNGNKEQSEKFTSLAKTFNPYMKKLR